MLTALRRLPRECSLPDGRPKVRFDTRADAKQYGRRRITVPFRVYLCRRCRYFHLATHPVARRAS